MVNHHVDTNAKLRLNTPPLEKYERSSAWNFYYFATFNAILKVLASLILKISRYKVSLLAYTCSYLDSITFNTVGYNFAVEFQRYI